MENIEELDLFDFPELIPSEVKEILDSFSEENNTYETCEDLVNALHSVNYTCEYELDAIPYGLKKIS